MTSEQKWTKIVKAEKPWYELNLQELCKYRDLIFLFVRRNFVAKYKQTILGPAWAIIQPFFTTVVFSIFFGNIAGLGASEVPNFVFYFSGTIVWTLFANSLTQTSSTFIGNAGILGKVYFPRLVMPLSTAISQFIAFFIQFVFFLLFMAFYMITGAGLAPNIYILMTPLIILQLSILGMGFGIIISAMTTKYRDLQMMVSFGVSLWQYSSPVAYDMFSRSSLMPGSRFYGIYMLNPVTSAINLFRYAYLGIGSIDWMYYRISWVITAFVLVMGLILFSKVERTFMDTV